MKTQKTYCCHCFTEIEKPNSPYCPMCGKQYKVHYSQSNELPAGTFLSGGRYFVGESIGSGGFGITYVGFDTRLNKRVLIKETFYSGLFKRNTFDKTNPQPLSVTYRSDISLDEIIKKTEKECRHLSEGEGLENIVKVYDFFSENNTAYIITEFIDGITLYDRVNQEGTYTWNELLDKITPLMQSLELLHSRHILHRDIKPQNIMIRKTLNNDEQFVLIDFGLARSTSAKTLASVGMAFSPGYAPFEQRAYLKKDGTYTDVYSLAATMYYALTGTDPNEELGETVEDNFPLITSFTSKYGVPKKPVSALKHALDPQYTDRCQTIDIFIKELSSGFAPAEKKQKQTAPLKKSPPPTPVPPVTVPHTTTQNTVLANDTNVAPPKTTHQTVDYIREEQVKKFPLKIVLSSVGALLGIVVIAVIIASSRSSPSDPDTDKTLSLSSDKDYTYTYTYSHTEDTDTSDTDSDQHSDSDSGIVLPSFVGKDLGDATDFLETEGIAFYTKEEYSNSYEKGKIIKQSPPEKTVIDKTDNVILTVSKGKKPTVSSSSSKTTSSKTASSKAESKAAASSQAQTQSNKVTVPNLVGLNYLEAMQLLEANDLYCSGSSVLNDTVPKDEVMSQSPAANTQVNRHSTVTFTYSAGPVTTHTTVYETDVPAKDPNADKRHQAMIDAVNQSKANGYTIGKIKDSSSDFLFVETGASEAEKAYQAYEITDDGVNYVCELGAGHTAFYLDYTTNTLGNFTAHMGLYFFGLLRYDNGSITVDEIDSGYVSNTEPYPEMPGTYIELTAINDYSLINQY